MILYGTADGNDGLGTNLSLHRRRGVCYTGFISMTDWRGVCMLEQCNIRWDSQSENAVYVARSAVLYNEENSTKEDAR